MALLDYFVIVSLRCLWTYQSTMCDFTEFSRTFLLMHFLSALSFLILSFSPGCSFFVLMCTCVWWKAEIILLNQKQGAELTAAAQFYFTLNFNTSLTLGSLGSISWPDYQLFSQHALGCPFIAAGHNITSTWTWTTPKLPWLMTGFSDSVCNESIRALTQTTIILIKRPQQPCLSALSHWINVIMSMCLLISFLH